MIRRAIPTTIAISAIAGEPGKEIFAAMTDDDETAEARFNEWKAKRELDQAMNGRSEME